MNSSLAIDPAVAATLTVLLNGLGVMIKNLPVVKNYLIPPILSIAGGVAYPAVVGAWSGPNVVLGIVVAMTSIGLHQVVQQVKYAKDDVSTKPPEV